MGANALARADISYLLKLYGGLGCWFRTSLRIEVDFLHVQPRILYSSALLFHALPIFFPAIYSKKPFSGSDNL